MAYASYSDLVSFGIAEEIANDKFGEPLLTKHLQFASAYMDTFLSSKFKLPLSEPVDGYHPQLKSCCISIAVYTAMVQSGFSPQGDFDANWRQRYDDMNNWLIALSKGFVSLPITTPDSDGYESGNLQGTPLVLNYCSSRY